MNPDLFTTNYQQLKSDPPNCVILPWGATEAHNNHLPYASDVMQATAFATEAALRAQKLGAKTIVLPTIPFGNNAQHLDQSVTIHLDTTTAFAILHDIVASLVRQKIDRMLLVNSHGGNSFKPLIRDIQKDFPILIILADVLNMVPELVNDIFNHPGDHAGELETSLMLYLSSDKMDIQSAGPGKRNPFIIKGLDQSGIWTPRPWSHVHPDSGSGDPSGATAAKGEKYFNHVCEALAQIICSLSQAQKGDLPYI